MKRLRYLLAAYLIVAAFVVVWPSTASAGGGGGCKGKNCEIPEVPWTLVLPGAGGAMAAGYYFLQRYMDRGGRKSDDE